MNLMQTLALILMLVVLTIPSVICALKGKWWVAFLFWGSFVAVICAIRVAKPGSFWDSVWSSVGAHEKSVYRFTKHRDRSLVVDPPW